MEIKEQLTVTTSQHTTLQSQPVFKMVLTSIKWVNLSDFHIKSLIEVLKFSSYSHCKYPVEFSIGYNMVLTNGRTGMACFSILWQDGGILIYPNRMIEGGNRTDVKLASIKMLSVNLKSICDMKSIS